MFTNVLVAVDGSEPAHKAAKFAADLAERYGAKLTILCVWSPVEDLGRSEAEEIVDREAHALEDGRHGWITRVAKFGDPAAVVIDYAQEDKIDLIVIGSRGRSGMTSLLLGSVSHRVATHAPCTCITVR